MSPQIIMAAVQFLGSKEGRQILGMLKSKDANIAKMMLKGLGAKKTTQSDIDDLFSLAEGYGSSSNEELVKNLSDIMIGTPQEYLIKAGGAAANGLLRYGAQRAENNANALATALLEGMRQHTPQQDAIYGYSVQDQASKLMAAKALNKGKNKAAMAREAADALNKVLGDFERQNDQVKAMAAASTLNQQSLPSTAWNYLNGMRSSSDKNRGNGGNQ